MAFVDSVRSDNAEARIAPSRAAAPDPVPTAAPDAEPTQTVEALQPVEENAASEPRFDNYRVQLEEGSGQFTEVLDNETGQVIRRIPTYQAVDANSADAQSGSDITA